jgi:hypothetical protein
VQQSVTQFLKPPSECGLPCGNVRLSWSGSNTNKVRSQRLQEKKHRSESFDDSLALTCSFVVSPTQSRKTWNEQRPTTNQNAMNASTSRMNDTGVRFCIVWLKPCV